MAATPYRQESLETGTPRRRRVRLGSAAAGLVGALATALALVLGSPSVSAKPSTTTSPIKHVVVILEENHSFDNLLGKFCAEVASGQIVRPGTDSSCDGATSGRISTGQTVPLVSAPDIVPDSNHDVVSQQNDINGGAMDGFNLNPKCATQIDNCYNQYDPLAGPCPLGSCIPNLAKLATDYTISDRTFELYQSPSWQGHLYFVTANQDGFGGFNPKHYSNGPTPVTKGPGWGCDAGTTAYYNGTSNLNVLIPSCIPNAAGSLGPNWAGYTGTKASYVPTIFDSLDAAHLSWKLYAGDGSVGTMATGWEWSICPTFAECLYTSQRNHLVAASDFTSAAQKGRLPAFSMVTPTADNSQHNGYSMSQGDNYVASMISALQAGPDWSSTAVFITWDDCGCLYDHVNPLVNASTWGVRVPMLIVSPYAKAGYTDSQPATFASVLAFVDHNFGLPALNGTVASAYDYSGAFCLSGVGCTPAGTEPVTMVTQRVRPPTPAQLAHQQVELQQDT